jgi:ATP cone domain-containing protein
MSSLPAPVPPTWVRKRDGRLVPFEADKISRALFAAAETAGRADVFLARELADVVTHFLGDEATGDATTTEQISEIVTKVLRELAQYALAAAFEEHARLRRSQGSGVRGQQTNGPSLTPAPKAEGVYRFALDDDPTAIKSGCLHSYALQAVWTRDLAAAHRDGLLTLGGLDAPGELASALLSPLYPDKGPLALLEALTAFPAQVAVLDGPEYGLIREASRRPKRLSHAWAEREAAVFQHELSLGLRLTGRGAVLELNGEAPPWADEAVQGPLFASQAASSDLSWTALLGEALAEGVLQRGNVPGQVRIDWHLAAKDFQPGGRERLMRLVRAGLVGTGLTFVFDRPRRRSTAAALAEGVQRSHPAVLLAVGLNLPRLAALVSEELPVSARDEPPAARSERLLERLKSLARLALSAALQKREFLRRQARTCSALGRGFLLDRARLVVVPVGLDEAVQGLLGRALCTSEPALDLGRAILRRLKEFLQQEGRASALETCLDSPVWEGGHTGGEAAAASAAGITCWDEAAAVRAQLHAIGELHAAAEGGTGVVFLPAEPLPAAEEVADWLHWAWEETSVVRLRLRYALPSPRQLTFAVSEAR